MFIFDDKISGNINTDKIREIVQKRYKKDDKWHTESYAYFGDNEKPVKIAENGVILSFYPAANEWNVVSVWYDDKTTKCWFEEIPVIGWVEVLDNGIQPYTAELQVPSESPHHRWGLRRFGMDIVIEPQIASYQDIATFLKSCEKDFTGKKE